jgi:parallel beta-helix repeat protein
MRNIALVVSLLLVGILLFGCTSSNNQNPIQGHTQDYTPGHTQNYTPEHTQNHTNNTPVETYKGGAIRIESDRDFTAANGVVKGSGTPADPYIIEGWTIDGSSFNTSDAEWGGIYIYGTSKYFVIRNCRVENVKGYGVSLVYVHAGRIENCTFTNNELGFSLEGSDNLIISGNTMENCKGDCMLGNEGNNNVTISNNLIADCGGDGINFLYYLNSQVINNTVRNNSGPGIRVSDSMNCTISNNVVQGNGAGGIDVSYSSWEGGDKNTVSNNDVSNNGGTGIAVLGIYDTITNNTVNWNKVGISLERAYLTDIVAGNNIISNNTASNNQQDGFYLDFHCEGNTVADNTFVSNDLAKTYHYDYKYKRVEDWNDMSIYDKNNTFTDNTYGTIYIYGEE